MLGTMEEMAKRHWVHVEQVCLMANRAHLLTGDASWQSLSAAIGGWRIYPCVARRHKSWCATMICEIGPFDSPVIDSRERHDRPASSGMDQ